jgi:hypothetical protein
MCPEKSPRGWWCSLPEGHAGDHVAKGLHDERDRWPRSSDAQEQFYCYACKDTGCSECADQRTMETPQGECWVCGRTVSNATGVKLTPSGKLECNDAQTGSCPRTHHCSECHTPWRKNADGTWSAANGVTPEACCDNVDESTLMHLLDPDEPKATRAAHSLAKAAVGWWEDHNGTDCHFCSPFDGRHDVGCPVGEYLEAIGRKEE